ncbi:MAG: hemolysin family protein [Clostridia bacterium]|nr:hemolysin family protein [Clostridia bacterium]
MDTDSWSQIIILVILIMFSAYFSATETAFSSLNKIRIKMLADDGNKRAALVLDMTENFDRLLTTVLIGNNIVNIASTSIATVFFISLLGNASGPTVSTVVMTVLVLIFGEITPKSIAKEKPESFAMFSAPFIKVLFMVFIPFVWFFSAWKKMLKKLFKLENNDAITGDELLNIVEEAEDSGGIDEEESDLIRSAISFSDLTAEDILTPRVDIIAIDKNDSEDKIAQVFDDSKFSRLPVYEEGIDNIIGFIHIRDFSRVKFSDDKDYNIDDILKNTVFVAKSMAVNDLLKLMQSKKTHMAIVTDEYGGTIGLVTLEDILEELVGEIWDESDEIVEDFVDMSDGSVKVLCSTQLSKMFDRLGMDVDDESESVSVGGWVIEQLCKIPEPGDSFSYENIDVTVTKVENRRIVEISVIKHELVEEEE